MKILIFDIENMANLVWSWQTYSRGGWRAIDTEMEWVPISFGAKWLGEKTKYYSLEQYKGYKPQIKRNKDGSTTFRKPDVRALVQDMRDLFDEADVVVGWNSRSFDVKKMNSYIISLGLKPYSPFLQVDVMAEKKKLASSNSNSLDATGEEWGIGKKEKHNGFPLWMGCAEGNKKALRKMKKYCIQDVDLTEKAYLYLRPYMVRHPNLGITIQSERPVCPKCGSQNGQKRGTIQTSVSVYKNWWCKDCQGWSRYRVAEKLENKPELV